ncbi:hypothetical protein [Bacillus pinisoli]|uniref:hypothetical protein n=1 Tax=Bacillus pinisoli TaxID=2901866 RepID=UPI001FF61486|nr:hypothetical protein [Bacillus pinisoli]
MKGLVVISLQNIIYSSFLVVEMLSQQDRLYAKTLLFIVFLYLAFFIAGAYGYTTKKALKMTMGSVTIFFLFQQICHWVFTFIS